MSPANIMAKDKTKTVLKMEYVSTPDVIWDQLKDKYNFTVDACASDKNYLLPKYWTKENSALQKNWDNEIVYCHPMYDSKIVKFIEKAFQHKCLAVFLIPANAVSNLEAAPTVKSSEPANATAVLAAVAINATC